MDLWLIFFTGLTSGGVTCAAMQGGLLASTIANQKKRERRSQSIDATPHSFDSGDWGPVAIFLTTKLLAYTLLGAVLGALGAVFTLSLNFRLFFQGFAALFMFASAMNLLDVHPIFRYLAFTPPRYARKLLKNTTTTNRLFAPGLLGLFTVLIPCGVTQAMEVLALSSGSAWKGALIMGTFVLGTAPVFALIGLATAKFSEVFRIYFLRAAAVLLIIMALYALNGILLVTNSPYSFDRLGPKLVKLLPPYEKSTNAMTQGASVQTVGGVQKITINISSTGYAPRAFKVKAGTPVELTLKSKNAFSCASSFTLSAFGISDFLQPTDTKVHTFIPTKKGLYTFACSMGMYSGTMEVI